MEYDLIPSLSNEEELIRFCKLAQVKETVGTFKN